MRPLLLLAILGLATTGCQRTPEQQQADQLRSNADDRGDAIEQQADVQANRLQQEASTLENEAERVGGMTGERLQVRADALKKESKLIQKQADMKADAIKESVDAQIKATESR